VGQLEVSVSATATKSCAVVKFSGECDTNTVQRVRDTVLSIVLAGFCRVIVDLSRLGFMCCMGMRALREAGCLIVERGGTVALAAPQPVVRRMLHLSAVDQWIPVYPSVAEAASGL
jgi:anti-sigma B factor antagonist